MRRVSEKSLHECRSSSRISKERTRKNISKFSYGRQISDNWKKNNGALVPSNNWTVDGMPLVEKTKKNHQARRIRFLEDVLEPARTTETKYQSSSDDSPARNLQEDELIDNYIYRVSRETPRGNTEGRCAFNGGGRAFFEHVFEEWLWNNLLTRS